MTMVLFRSCVDDDDVAEDGEGCRSIFATNKGLKKRVSIGESDLLRCETLQAEHRSRSADILAITSRQRDDSTQARLISLLPVECLFNG